MESRHTCCVDPTQSLNPNLNPNPNPTSKRARNGRRARLAATFFRFVFLITTTPSAVACWEHISMYNTKEGTYSNIYITRLCYVGCVQKHTWSISPGTRARHFCGFCKRFIPVPDTSSVSSVRLPYPYPELLCHPSDL